MTEWANKAKEWAYKGVEWQQSEAQMYLALSTENNRW